MHIGVPKETKNHDYRVGVTPSAVKELISHNHSVFVENNVGDAISIENERYTAVGASIVGTPQEIVAGV